MRLLVVLALWGWPGILLGLLLGVDLLERAFKRNVTFRFKYKMVVAAVILGVGIFKTWSDLSAPPVDVPLLNDSARERIRAGTQLVLEDRVRCLMREHRESRELVLGGIA